MEGIILQTICTKMQYTTATRMQVVDRLSPRYVPVLCLFITTRNERKDESSFAQAYSVDVYQNNHKGSGATTWNSIGFCRLSVSHISCLWWLSCFYFVMRVFLYISKVYYCGQFIGSASLIGSIVVLPDCFHCGPVHRLGMNKVWKFLYLINIFPFTNQISPYANKTYHLTNQISSQKGQVIYNSSYTFFLFNYYTR